MSKYDKDEKTDNIAKPMPTITSLRSELEQMLRGTGHNEIWFLNLIEPQKTYEKPRKVSGKNGLHWVWAYADRVKVLLTQYLQSDKKLRDLIQAAREDKIFWRGDDFKMFNSIITETEKMREVGIVKYKKAAMIKVKALRGRKQ